MTAHVNNFFWKKSAYGFFLCTTCHTSCGGIFPLASKSEHRHKSSMTDSVREIVALCGGPENISRKSREMDVSDYIRPVSVYDWYRNGIPEKRWPVVMALCNVSEAELHAANKDLRHAKKNAVASEMHAA